MDDSQKNDILKSISLTGVSLKENSSVNVAFGGTKASNIGQLIEFNSGKPQIRRSLVNKFKLILNKPKALAVISSFEFRCALCKKVISYPCWYMEVKYVKNRLHYFICFDETNAANVTTKCFRGE